MMTISQVQAMLKNKEISCRSLTKAYLDAAHRENPQLNAYISIHDDAALAAADSVDLKIASGGDLSPLEGVPFVLKDNISTKGLTTTCASKMLEHYVPIFDAHAWSKLKEQNAVLIGKGNMDEFAMGSTCESSYFGGAKNPHNPEHVPGGSSGGSAAAVAGNLAVYGIGSDTGGSVRMPASFCGIVGLKPTYGAVSRYGLIAYGSSLDQIGTFGSCVSDAALVYDAILGQDPKDMTSKAAAPISGKLTGDVRGLRIGIASEYFEGLPGDILAAMEEAKKTYEKMGAEIVPLHFPMLKLSLPAYYILACAEASSNLGRFDGLRYGHKATEFTDLEDFVCRTRTEGFGKEVRRRILLGSYVLSAGYYDAYYNKAVLLRKRIMKEFSEMFERCDVLLTPTTPVTALKFGSELSPVEVYQTDICTCSVNTAGLPAVSIPCGFDGKGLPIGMQLIGDSFREDLIMNTALAFERETEGCHIKDTKMGVSI